MLLTKNEIKAVKKLEFKVVHATLSIHKMNTEFHSCGVDLASVLVWAVREQRLYSADTDIMEFNIKLDGRELGGKFLLEYFGMKVCCEVKPIKMSQTCFTLIIKEHVRICFCSLGSFLMQKWYTVSTS